MSRYITTKDYGRLDFDYVPSTGFYQARIPVDNSYDKKIDYDVMFDGIFYNSNVAHKYGGIGGNAYLYDKRRPDTGEPFFLAPALGIVLATTDGMHSVSYGVTHEQRVNAGTSGGYSVRIPFTILDNGGNGHAGSFADAYSAFFAGERCVAYVDVDMEDMKQSFMLSAVLCYEDSIHFWTTYLDGGMQQMFARLIMYSNGMVHFNVL